MRTFPSSNVSHARMNNLLSYKYMHDFIKSFLKLSYFRNNQGEQESNVNRENKAENCSSTHRTNAAHCNITDQLQVMLCVVLQGREMSLMNVANGPVHTTSVKTNVTLHCGHKPAILRMQT